MDWITLLIEAVGVVILMLWIVMPIREFRAILKRIRSREIALAQPPGGGFDVARDDNRREPRG